MFLDLGQFRHSFSAGSTDADVSRQKKRQDRRAFVLPVFCRGRPLMLKKKTDAPTLSDEKTRSRLDVEECALKKIFASYVMPQDVYSVDEAARLLHISPDRARSFAMREKDPFPIRCFSGGARGSFVLRDELLGWLARNSISAKEAALQRRKKKDVRKR